MKLFKKVFQASLALLLIGSIVLSTLFVHTASAQTTDELSKTGIIVNVKKANVYKGPAKKYGTTGGTVKQGEIVTIYESSGNWTYIESNDDYGWVWSEYIQPATDIGMVAYKSTVNLYKGPGKSYGKNGTKLTEGTAVVIFESSKSWRHVYINGVDGWVSEKYIKSPEAINEKDFKTTSNVYKTLQSVEKISNPTVKEGYITSEANRNLYNSAAKSSGTKGKIAKNTKVTILGSKGSWVFVQTKSQNGWLSSTYVTDSVKTGFIRKVKSYANIYKGAGKKYGTDGKLYLGTAVEVKEQKNNWRKIQIGNKEGWVWAEYVSTNLSVLPNANGMSKLTSAAKVYKAPDSKSSTLEKVPKNSKVYYYDVYNDWRFIHAGHVQGWVKNDYLEPEVTIFLDPGHGGSDPGAVGNGMKEKDIVLEVGLEARKLFEKTPYRVLMTRDSDTNNLTANGKNVTTSSSLTMRADFANSNKRTENDIYISIHVNAGGGTGTETYVFKTTSKLDGYNYDKESKALATYIQKRLVEYMGFRDRGVKQANYAVLRLTNMPSVLVELGFIDNSSDAAKLKQKYYRQQAAKAIYHGTLDYYGSLGFNVSSYY